MSLDNNKAVTQSGISSREKDVHDGTKSSPMEGVIVPEVTFKIMDDYVQPPKLVSRPLSYYRYVEKTPEEVYDQIEYDMDEEDCAWLELINEQRAKSNLAQVSMDAFEQLMDRFEKESFFQCQSEAKAPNPQTDEDAVCAVCLDGECYTNNVILFCDLCDLAVHQKCYGVPSIPDGSWVCQRCLLSPSKAVECCLCPNRRGAFKQTDDGRWVHVGCALWIPEVDFANVTFLEPVVGINSVAAARWKLVCYICKQRSAGACVQCADPSCYTGFHVTCAQQAGLTMVREHVKDAEQGAPLLKKTTAFCDEHSESFAKKPTGEKGDDKNRGSGAGEASVESNNQLALKKARRLLAESRNSCLPLFYPVITVSSIAKISRKMSIEQKEAFISRLHCYWTLKRQSRNGMPLLRSRQFGNFHRVVFKNMIQNESTKENFEQKVETKSFLVDGALASKLKDCHRLRQDLEKVRLLIEQVRKREKLKVEQVKLYEQEVNLRLSPLMLLFSRTLDQIDELVHSLHLGSESMECVKGSVQRSEFLLKMRQRVKNYDYRNLDAFEADLRSLVMESSPRDVSERKSKDLEDLKQQGSAIINVLSCELSQVGYDPQTGLHLPNLLSESTSRGTVLSAINEKLLSSSRSELHENSKTAASTKGGTQPSQQTSTARGRGRGKRKAPDASTDASLNNSNLDGRADAELAESSGSPSKQANNPLGLTEKSTSSAAPSGVNRRTAVLFNNKTRKSAKHCDVSGTNAGATTKDSKPHRRPGRPPKQGGQRSDDGPSSRDRPFMLSSDCVGFGDRDLAERCGKRQNSAENQDFAKMIESAGGKGGMAHSDSVLEAATLGRQSFMQYRGGPQDSKSQKGSGGASARDGSGEVSSRRSVESVSKESFLQYRNMSTSNSDVEENSDAESSSSSSSSETYCESTSSQGSSSESNADESVDSDQGATRGDALQMQNLQPLDLVWAKCRGYPWYPALIIDPKTSSNDTYENGIPIPVPPDELLSLQKKHPRPMLLVLFFDAKRTWQWLPANKLQRLGDDSARDRSKLTDSKKPNIRRAVQNAYEKAIQHKKLVSTETTTPSPQENMDTA